jgi:putative oxidoreductase
MKNICPVSESTKGFALTVVRVVLGIIFFMHGSQKVLGWWGGGGLAATVQGMTGMGLPAVLVYVVCFTEFLGGIALILGLLTRLAALGILVVMVGAVVTVHGQNGFFINWFLKPGVGHGYEYNLALIAMSLSLILGGGGRWVLDSLCGCKKEGG